MAWNIDVEVFGRPAVVDEYEYTTDDGSLAIYFCDCGSPAWIELETYGGN